MMRKLYDLLSSLNLGFWLMGGTMLFLAIGSFLTGETAGINDMALLTWLARAPISISWWLWVAIGLLAALVLNTVLCSIEAVRSRYGRSRLLHLLAPQLMHAGFLLVVLAHLLSAVGGAKMGGQISEGMEVILPDNSRLRFDALTAAIGPFGMPTSMRAAVTHTTASGSTRTAVISPNHPYFPADYGIYLKHLQPGPVPTAIVELHREPGAGAALAGALLFTAGNVILLAIRRGRTV